SHMDPGYTHYDRRNLYASHDVTSLLKPGKNTITAVLGNGFYNCQSKAVWDFETAHWRDRPALICEIVTLGKDGKADIAVATDESWKTETGPYTYNNIYSGDRYDARIDWPGVRNNGFDDSGWKNARVVSAPSSLLKAQSMPSIRPVEKITPSLSASWGDTIFVFDMGKNIAGVPAISVKGPRGTKLTVSSGEMLDADGRLMLNNIDVYYRPVKPGEKFQTDEFILAETGAPEYFSPEFTYHGFRYVEVKSSEPVSISPEDVQGLFMHTDVQPVGYFSSSSPLLNSIYDATMLSYLGNLHSIPTDCPQREKNGWTADAHVAIDLALLNYDGITLYEKWMNDFADNQRRSGNISGIIPSSGWGYGQWPGPVWDAAMFIIPEALYDYYGDTRAIEQLYPSMERYFDWCRANETSDSLLENGIGDWLSYKAQTPTPFTSSVYYYLDNVKMARFARLLGKDPAPYDRKAVYLKDKINELYFNKADSTYANGTQAALGVALYAGIVPAEYEQAVAAKLRDIVAANDHFLDFGLLGSKTVLRMLTRYGYLEDAYKMATKTTAPSWGYWLTECGYTTLPETWTLSPQFNDASLNHVFMGDISAWMTSDLAGINFDPARPGFEHIIFRPHFPSGLDSASAIYLSVRGDISSSWRREGNSIVMTVDVPHGCEATLELPEASGLEIPGQVAVNAATAPIPAGRSVINITLAK
ncbi:MAG: glycoside hydrolase family 78 protein, partial [Muribaculaceae bacterium]|nr:glycoside hydrolase family 78 protein [Muribaculaceae bacterium]